MLRALERTATSLAGDTAGKLPELFGQINGKIYHGHAAGCLKRVLQRRVSKNE